MKPGDPWNRRRDVLTPLGNGFLRSCADILKNRKRTIVENRRTLQLFPVWNLIRINDTKKHSFSSPVSQREPRGQCRTMLNGIQWCKMWRTNENHNTKLNVNIFHRKWIWNEQKRNSNYVRPLRPSRLIKQYLSTAKIVEVSTLDIARCISKVPAVIISRNNMRQSSVRRKYTFFFVFFFWL